MKIGIIGPYPPPYGGISVHIKRMKKYLEQMNIKVNVYDESKKNNEKNVIKIKKYRYFIFKLFFLKDDLLHFHTVDKRIRMMLGLYKITGKKVLLTLHGESLNEQLNESNFVVRKLLIYSLKKIDKIICVNPKNREELLKLGFKEGQVEYIPSYINPIEDKEDINNIPVHVNEFMKKTKFLIAANGCVRFYRSEDLYGFDMLIDLMNKLSNDKIDAGLLISVLDVQSQRNTEKEYYDGLKAEIRKLNLEDKICLFEVQDTEFYPILRESDLFIRPTNTDGFGVSIAEAIYYNVPAVASDVCNRPEGTIIFKSRNLDELFLKTVDLIMHNDEYKNNIRNITYEDNAEKVFKIYKSIVNIS